MWSGAWNKVDFWNLLLNTYLPSTVSRALEWWSRGPGFKPNWGQFLTIFFCSSPYEALLDNLTERDIVKNPMDFNNTSVTHPTLLPTAYVVRWEGNAFTRVCPSIHLSVHRGVPRPGPAGGGGYSLRGVTDGVLDTPRSVCLLRSRRTFFMFLGSNVFAETFSKTPRYQFW